MPSPLTRHSPLSGLYRQYAAHLTTIAGWRVAAHYGDPQRERQQIAMGAVLGDWSHIGKISLSGKEAGAIAQSLCPGANAIAPLNSLTSHGLIVLRLTANDFLILCLPGNEAHLMQQIGLWEGGTANQRVTIADQTGALGCLVLGGARRDEVLERSTALDVRRDRLPAGRVVQSSVHAIRCTLYRTAQLDLLLQSRSLSESLFEALMDVGVGVGLRPAGIEALPVQLGEAGDASGEHCSDQG